MRYDKFKKENTWYEGRPIKSECQDDGYYMRKEGNYSSSIYKSTNNNECFFSRQSRSRSKSVFPERRSRSRSKSVFSERRRSRSRSKSVFPERRRSRSRSKSVFSERKRTQSIGSCGSDSGLESGRSSRSRSRSRSVAPRRYSNSVISDPGLDYGRRSRARASGYRAPSRMKYIENDYSYSSKQCMKNENQDQGIVVMEGFQLSDLYALWVQRRAEFLAARREGRLHLMYGPEDGFLCGLCFKKFRRDVQLQQHCEELLHYACITCGRFFNSYTALGQHCIALNHTKD